MKVEDSLSQNMEEISQGNPGELTKIFQGFSTKLEEMYQDNSQMAEPSDDFFLRSESIEIVSIKTEEVMYNFINLFSCPISFLFCYLETLVRSLILSIVVLILLLEIWNIVFPSPFYSYKFFLIIKGGMGFKGRRFSSCVYWSKSRNEKGRCGWLVCFPFSWWRLYDKYQQGNDITFLGCNNTTKTWLKCILPYVFGRSGLEPYFIGINFGGCKLFAILRFFWHLQKFIPTKSHVQCHSRKFILMKLNF